MKQIFAVIIFFIITFVSFGQNGPQQPLAEGLTIESFDNLRNTLGRSKYNPIKNTKIEGSVHLFDNWDGQGSVVTRGRKIPVRNINFNARTNRFEMKVASDSIYIFNFRQIDYVTTNNKKFVLVEFPDEQRSYVVEEMAKANNFAIYKKHYTEIKAGSPNPMRGTVSDKYLKKNKTFVKIDGKVERFSIKRKKVLKLMGAKAEDVEAYAKSKDLSFKSDQDLKEIVEYYNTL